MSTSQTQRNRASVRSLVRGLYGLADAGGGAGDPVRLADALLIGGCRLIQLRCKDWKVDEIERAGREVAARCHQVGATFILNDHAALVRAVGADGVHVGQLDIDSDAARRLIGPDAILGRSTHSEEQLAQACRNADYVAFGPIWSTKNTDRDKGERGLAALARARDIVGELPLVAIGSIDASRVPLVRAAGADAWAVIGAVRDAADPVAACRELVAAGEG